MVFYLSPRDQRSLLNEKHLLFRVFCYVSCAYIRKCISFTHASHTLASCGNQTRDMLGSYIKLRQSCSQKLPLYYLIGEQVISWQWYQPVGLSAIYMYTPTQVQGIPSCALFHVTRYNQNVPAYHYLKDHFKACVADSVVSFEENLLIHALHVIDIVDKSYLYITRFT